MREKNRQILRFFLVLGLGVSLALLAGQSAHREKPVLRAKTARPEQIVRLTAIESAVADQCLLAPRESGARVKRKAIACG